MTLEPFKCSVWDFDVDAHFCTIVIDELGTNFNTTLFVNTLKLT